MRMLIVDDEERIREGIRNYTKTQFDNFEMVQTACDSEEAFKIAEEITPDILVTDVVMPGLNGIELARSFREKFKSIKIIMISGYGEVEYLKQSFKFEAVDYILKPIDIKEFHSALAKTITLCDEEKQAKEQKKLLEEKLKESLPLLREKFLLYLLTGEYSDIDYVYERMCFLNLYLNKHSKYVVINFNIGDKISRENEAKNEQRLTGLDSIEVFELIRKELNVIENCEFFSKTDNEIIVIVNLDYDTDTALFKDMILKMCSDIQKNIYLSTGRSITVGIGDITDSVLEIAKCYKQSVEAVNQQFILGKGHVIFYSDIHNQKGPILSFPADLGKELLANIYKGNDEAVDMILCRVFSDFFSGTGISYQMIQNVKLEIVSVTISIIKGMDIQMDEAFYLENLHWDELLILQTLDEIKGWLMEKLKLISIHSQQIRNRKSNLLIQKIDEIIEKKFSEGLSIQLIADQLKVSPNYLSALFKYEKAVNFTEYLTNIRLHKAKELMKEPSLKIYEICSMVGYEDQNYFARIFKKYFGVSPSDYREIKR